MAKIFVTAIPYSGYREDVKINGVPLEGVEGIREADSIVFSLPSRGTGVGPANKMFRLRPEGVFVLLYESYNARSEPVVKATEGLAEVFEYGDAHGKRWAAFYRVVADTWKVDYDVPGHHGHGWVLRRVVGDRNSFQFASAERKLESAPLI